MSPPKPETIEDQSVFVPSARAAKSAAAAGR